MTFFIALSIALAGYAPSFTMQTAMEPAAAVQTVSGAGDVDCMKAMVDDCCDKQNSADKSKCLFDDACAARCHVSAGLELIEFRLTERHMPSVVVAFAEPPPRYAERAGPHYRPPIL